MACYHQNPKLLVIRRNRHDQFLNKIILKEVIINERHSLSEEDYENTSNNKKITSVESLRYEYEGFTNKNWLIQIPFKVDFIMVSNLIYLYNYIYQQKQSRTLSDVLNVYSYNIYLPDCNFKSDEELRSCLIPKERSHFLLFCKNGVTNIFFFTIHIYESSTLLQGYFIRLPKNIDYYCLRNIQKPAPKLLRKISYRHTNINDGRATMGINNVHKNNPCFSYNSNLWKPETMSKDFFHILNYCILKIKNIQRKYGNNKVSTLYFQNWHFKDFNQGYSLFILLRNIHIYTLNIVKNFCFVIITSFKSIVKIKITMKYIKEQSMILHNSVCQDLQKMNTKREYFLLNGYILINSGNTYLQGKYIQINRNLTALTYNILENTKNFSEDNNNKIQGMRNSILPVNDYETIGTSFSKCSIVLNERTYNGSATSDAESREDELCMDSQYSKFHIPVNRAILDSIFKNNKYIYSTYLLHSRHWLSNLFNTFNKNECFKIESLSHHETLKKVTDKVWPRKYDAQEVTGLRWKHVHTLYIYPLFLKPLVLSITKVLFNVDI